LRRKYLQFLWAVGFWSFLLLGSLVHAQSVPGTVPDSTSQQLDVNAKVAAMTHQYVEWSNNALSTPGLSAELKEVERKTVEGKLMVKYRVFVKGVPAKQPFALLSWPLNSAKPVGDVDGLTVQPDGLLVCAGREAGQCHSAAGKDDPVQLAFYPAKGEPFRFALLSRDEKSKILFSVVPDPIKASANGCEMEVVRLLPKFELAVVRAKGFKANETLSFESKSFNEVRNGSGKADEHGNYVTALLPVVQGHETGTAQVALKSAGCSPSLSFEWGK
jgi:hypothetical protein